MDELKNLYKKFPKQFFGDSIMPNIVKLIFFVSVLAYQCSSCLCDPVISLVM